MNKIVQIKIFNDILNQFFNYLENTFPACKSDLLITKNAIQFIRNSNPRLIIEQFMKLLTPYRKQIYECDEDFFLNFESNFLQADLTSENILHGMKIKKVWMSPDTTDKQKAYIWLYFQKLLRAGENVLW